MGATPVVIVETGGMAITNTDGVSDNQPLATPMTPVATLGIAVTLVAAGGLPVTLVNPDGTLWEPE